LDSKPEVKEFVDFYLKNAPKLVKDVKYVALPQSAYKMGTEHLSKGKIGTVFGGTAEVGVKIEELMKREANF
jgi:phosphate transport system substrate-binding protein